MDRELLIQNIERLCVACGVKVTNACREAKVGTSFVPDIRRGQTPSVSKVADLAAYLGVTTSELLGEPLPGIPADAAPLLALWDELNEEGREQLTEYGNYLVQSGKYGKKSPAPELGAEA